MLSNYAYSAEVDEILSGNPEEDTVEHLRNPPVRLLLKVRSETNASGTSAKIRYISHGSPCFVNSELSYPGPSV